MLHVNWSHLSCTFLCLLNEDPVHISGLCFYCLSGIIYNVPGYLTSMQQRTQDFSSGTGVINVMPCGDLRHYFLKPVGLPSGPLYPKVVFHREGLSPCICLCRSLGTCSFISSICYHEEQGGQCHGSTVAKSSGNTYLHLVVWEQHRGLYSLWTYIKTIKEEFWERRKRRVWKCF